MSKTFTHIALHVKDEAISRKFYQDWCGMAVVRENKGSTWLASPGNDNMVVVLVPGRLPRKFNGAANISHIGIAVDSRKELFNLLARAKKEGRLHRDLERHDPPVGELFMVRDPDGYVVEFSHGQPLGPRAK